MAEKPKTFKLTKGPFKGKTVELAGNSHEDLLYEIVDVLFGIEECLVSDESHINDFSDQEPFMVLRQRFLDFYGMELPEDPEEQYLGKLAERIIGERKND